MPSRSQRSFKPAYPVIAGHWRIDGHSLECRLPRQVVEISAPGRLLRQTLRLCTGRNTWQYVRDALARSWDGPMVDDFLVCLAGAGMLVEAGALLADWTRVAWLPQAYGSAAAARVPPLPVAAQARLVQEGGNLRLPARAQAFADVLQKRRSVRTFDDRAVGRAELLAVLWALYGVTGVRADGMARRTVPSAGGGYALTWCLALFRPAGNWRPGLYRLEFGRKGGVYPRRLHGEASQAWSALLDPRLFEYAHAAVFPAAAFDQIGAKYGNRAPAYCAIEVGHACQTAALMAASLEVAAVSRGDVVETEVLRMFGLPGDAFPLAALVVGAMPDLEQEARAEQGAWLELRGVPAQAGGKTTFAAVGGPIELNGQQLWSGGRATEPTLAVLRAEAEAWERRAWMEPRDLSIARIADLPGAVHPQSLVAYTSAQYRRKNFPFSAFSAQHLHAWRAGIECGSGGQAWLPAQCVYSLLSLPSRWRAQAYAAANTSGMAAWTDVKGALCRAVIELLERDALLRAWADRRRRPEIAWRQLPSAQRARLRAWARSGVNITLLDLTEGLVHVVAAFAQGAGLGITCVTSAAGFSFEEAVDDALHEAESRLSFPVEGKAPPMRAVRSIADHEVVYAGHAHFRAADFLVRGDPPRRRTQKVCRDWSQLHGKLRDLGFTVYMTDLTPPGASVRQGRVDLRVVRALVPGLVPIWFGHGMAPLGLPRLSQAIALAQDEEGAAAHFNPVHPFT